MVTPTAVPNPRHDVLVTSADGEPLRQTTYSGRLFFGAPAARGVMMSRLEFNGALFVPDSLPYLRTEVERVLLSLDTWVASAGEYLFVPSAEARFVDDPREPAVTWIQLALVVQGFSGSIIGYRATVSAPPGAIRTAPLLPTA